MCLQHSASAVSRSPVLTVGWCNSGESGVIGSPKGVYSNQLVLCPGVPFSQFDGVTVVGGV